jgi:sRNA-binding regulator protein Hfq
MKNSKPKRWSHQRELDSLIGEEVKVTFLAGRHDFVSGMLVASDAYTIQLATNHKSVMTYFKHGIRCYEARPVAV